MLYYYYALLYTRSSPEPDRKGDRRIAGRRVNRRIAPYHWSAGPRRVRQSDRPWGPPARATDSRAHLSACLARASATAAVAKTVVAAAAATWWGASDATNHFSPV